MPTRRITKLLRYAVPGILVCSAALLSAPAHAEESEPTGLWQSVKDHVSDITGNGRWNLYLSGYAYHNRDQYSEKTMKKLNEKAWGLGVGKTVRNSSGNDESLYFLALRDSNKDIQWNVGYAYQWIFQPGRANIELGAGLTAALISRTDRNDGVPFPAVLPIFSAGTREAKLMATYVPKISTTNGKGDVILLFLKFSV